MSLAICNGIEQVADVINTLVESVEKHVAEVRTQLVLSVLLNEGTILCQREAMDENHVALYSETIKFERNKFRKLSSRAFKKVLRYKSHAVIHSVMFALTA